MNYLFLITLLWAIFAILKVDHSGNIVYQFDKTATYAMRSFAAIGIVLVHMPMYISSPYLPFLKITGSWNGIIVGFFFFLSGYGLLKSYLSKGNDYLSHFFRHRLGKILIPAFVATIVYFIVDELEGTFSAERSKYLLMTGNFIRPAGWFVQTLIIYYALFYFCMKYIKNVCYGLAIMFLFSLLWIIVVRNVLHWNSYIWSSVLAFNSGTIMAYMESKFRGGGYIQHRRACLLVVLVFSMLEFCLLTYNHHAIPSTINCAIYPILFMPLIYATGFVKWHWVAFLGSISYEIYLMHFIVIEQTRYWPFRVEYWFAISFIIIVLASWIVNRTANKMSVRI